ncbi:transposase [Deinococcus sp.]|uniref:transposase n=1 Tax=Deinococcus sp. TaxID=47478 RepID=UPI003B5B387C
MTTTQLHQAKIDEQPVIWEVPDALWTRLAPLLLIDKPRKKSGRPARDARSIFNGLIWLARTGSQWSQIPAQFGPTTTIHNRFSAWVEHGCLERAWAVLLEEYGEVIGIEWTWQSADGCIVKAPLGKKGPVVRRKRPEAIPLTEANLAQNERS